MTRRKVRQALAGSRLEATPFIPTKADVKRWTELLNFVMFEGRIPKWRTITLRPMRPFALCSGHHGRKRYCTIELRDTFESFAAFYAILAHELCHSAEFNLLGTMSHGAFFYSHRQMLRNIGVKLQSRY